MSVFFTMRALWSSENSRAGRLRTVQRQVVELADTPKYLLSLMLNARSAEALRGYLWGRGSGIGSQCICRRGFLRTQHCSSLYEDRGWHVTPAHYYEPIPDTRELSDEVWSSPSSMPGVDLNQRLQLDLLHTFSSKFKSEYDRFPASSADPTRFHFGQTLFCSVDAELLYCMIRHFKPRNMIEIGSGMSTLLAAEAIQKNETEGNPCRLIAIEPHPKEFLRRGFSNKLKAAFASYDPDTAGSFWMRRAHGHLKTS